MVANGDNKYPGKEEKPGRRERLNAKTKELIYFLTYGIWRSNPDDLSSRKNVLYNATKTIILTIRNIRELNIAASARSLTYRTLLSIVPLLAIIFAIARGFGIENIMQSSIFNLMTGGSTEDAMVDFTQTYDYDTTFVVTQEFSTGNGRTDIQTDAVSDVVVSEETAVEEMTGDLVNLLFRLINNSLEEAKGGGIFAGVGILLFLYTVMLLFNDVERNLNLIWQVRSGRSIGRKIVDYTAMVLLIPIFLILVNALNILNYPQNQTLKIIYILYPFIPRLLDIVPIVVMILLFTVLYKFIPNTRVKFQNALIAGVIAGIAFQVFQMLFLSGQLWITKYNAIYGTFAAIPLMLLWIQVSWFIALIGAEISYAAQNISKFSFEKETRNISRRYKDFFTLILTSEIVKRFAYEKPPLSADELSVKCKVPSRLTNNILNNLLEVGIVSTTPSLEDDRVTAFQPAVDINLITVNYLMTKIDKLGSEDFMIDLEGEYSEHWKALTENRLSLYNSDKEVLLKDL